jgi:hypothetical protein
MQLLIFTTNRLLLFFTLLHNMEMAGMETARNGYGGNGRMNNTMDQTRTPQNRKKFLLK